MQRRSILRATPGRCTAARFFSAFPARTAPKAPRRHPLEPPTLARPSPQHSQRGPSPPPNTPWSTRTLLLLGTITGLTMYNIGMIRGAQVTLENPLANLDALYNADGVDGELGLAGGPLPSALQAARSFLESLWARSSVPPPPTRKEFKRALGDISSLLPAECIVTDRDSLVSHGLKDWDYMPPEALPGAVLYPRSTEDVVEIVKVAARYRIPIIPFSGGTSLEGATSALACEGVPEQLAVKRRIDAGDKVPLETIQPGIAWTLDFSENMNHIVALHPGDLDAVVQPGITYDALNAELALRGIPQFFPVDPAPGAMIGGMVGTGASGTNAVRYGTMRDNVLNLTVVLSNGQIVKTRQRAKKSSAGPDLTKLFVGSEGTYGIVTEATLKLQPVLPTSVAVAAFPSVQSAADAVLDLVQSGVSLACIELLDDEMMRAINASKTAGTRVFRESPYLFLKLAGTHAQIKSDMDLVRQVAKKHSAAHIDVARDARDADAIWYARKAALYSAVEYVPGARCWVTDVCVPLSNFPQLVSETRADLDASKMIAPLVGHAGDGNFHALILFRNEEEHRTAAQLVHRLVHRAQRLDGTCTGEHGVGHGKSGYLVNELGRPTLNTLRQIKRLLDPLGILNPGKILPPTNEPGGHDH